MTNLYQHDYKPGRLNLVGQQKPRPIIEARAAADAAWLAYDLSIDEKTGHANQQLLSEAQRLENEAQRLSAEWNMDYQNYHASREHDECQHLHTVVETTGGMHFSAGEVWDDIHEALICLDCGEEIG